MKKKVKSSFEEFIEDEKQKASFEKGYNDLLLSELILAFKEEDVISVKRLTAAVGVSPTIIQKIRPGKMSDEMQILK